MSSLAALEGSTLVTYVGVDLRAWRGLDRRQQELMVGRDKLSGCPLENVDDAGNPVALSGCPVSGTTETDISGGPNDPFREPPDTSVPVLRQSHVQRANHHVRPASDRNSLRVFRQGYAFLEPLGMAQRFRAGLNFVSFQNTPERMLRMLTQNSWLGGTNFSGDPDNQLPGMDRLLTVRAGGVFFVPPVTDEERSPCSSILL